MAVNFHVRLTLYITIAVVLFFISIFYYNFLYTQNKIRALSLDNANAYSISAVEKIEKTLSSVEQVPLYLAQLLKTHDFLGAELGNTIKNFILSMPSVYGCAIAFAPGVLEDAPSHFSPYYHRDGDNIALAYLNSSHYKYWEKSWFIEPQKDKKPVWSEPYFDKGGGENLMTTFSVPVYRKDKYGKEYFYAVVTADVSTKWLQDIVTNIKVYKTGHAFIVSRSGLLVVHHNKKTISTSSIFDLPELNTFPKLKNLAQEITNGASGMSSYVNSQTGQEVEVIYRPLPSSGWSLVLFIPTKELFAQLYEHSFVVVCFALIWIAGIALLISVVAYKATVPLRQLSKNTEEISKGNLDIELPIIKRLDEIGKLTQNFDNMRNSLKEYIINLTNTVAMKERVESELKIARIIQADFLHKIFPPFPQHKAFDIYASLIPAREVGGDLYDFFFIDDEQLFFSIGDVSDKGIPAALFMAITKTLIKSIAEYEHNPAKVLERVNNELSLDNESNMFVTVFCGILNIKTGEVSYTNAGHNAPLLIREGQEIQEIYVPKSLALGVAPNVSYVNTKFTLNHNDKLILYTDGITEAMCKNKIIFGLDKFKDILYKSFADTLINISENINDAVKAHAAGAEQSDDITLMIVEWFGVQR